MSIVIVARIRPLPEYRDEVVAAIEETIARVHAEDEGCELYALHETDDELVMIEKWASPEAEEAHRKSPAANAVRPRFVGKLERPLDMMVLRPRPAGAADKGAL